MTTNLWSPIKVGNLALEHRLAMSPMTRSRALPDGTPGPLTAEYYTQRASLGLLITEGVQPSEDGQGYLATPGVHTDAHVAGWREVTDAVHGAGGHLFMQLMHVGRVSHPDNTPHGRQPVAPSPIATGTGMFTATGMQDTPEPRALSVEEIQATVADFRRAAARAIEAGADGVEVHGANGYLVQQFLSPNSNTRTDAYGGSTRGRIRFAVEVVRAVVEEIGPERVGLRISPEATLNGIDEGPARWDTYRALVSELAPLGLAYLHVMHGNDDQHVKTGSEDDLLRELRSGWPGVLVLNRFARPVERIGEDIESGLADVVAVGRPALANPDLVERLRTGASLNEADHATFYGGDAHGYTDYPTLTASA